MQRDLALDEEPTIHRKKFIAFCEELIARGLPDQATGDTRARDVHDHQRGN